MVGFRGMLGTGQVEDQKMMKDNLIDGKNCEQVQWQLSVGLVAQNLTNFIALWLLINRRRLF